MAVAQLPLGLPARKLGRRPRRKQRLCANCGRDLCLARDRCNACYQYWRIHGTERPASLFLCAPITQLSARSTGRECRSCGIRFNPIKFTKREGKFVFDGARKFCSDKCGKQSLSKQRRKVSQGIHCETCRTLFTPIVFAKGKPIARLTKKVCSEACRDALLSKLGRARTDHYSGQDHPHWKGGIRDKGTRGRGWKRICERIRKRQRYTCGGKDCGATEESLGYVLHVHHKVPFHNDTNARCANRASNLIALCHPCHGKADAAVKERQFVFGLVIGDWTRKGPKNQRGERNHAAKLTSDQVLEIRNLVAVGTPVSEVMRKFSITQSGVQRIYSGKGWKHLGGPRTKLRTKAAITNSAESPKPQNEFALE